MTRGTWREQYERTWRWYARFADINGGKPHEWQSDNYRDDVHAFFINCYHLKDWLINDPGTGLARQEVEDCVNASPDLCLCGDLANGSKHMKLTQAPRASQDTALTATRFALDVNTKVISATYEVMSGGQAHDAFGIGTRALADWDAFLTSKGLLPL